MNTAKRKKLEAKGWRFMSADEFLGLTEVESAIVDIKLALADAVKAQRQKNNLSQVELAKRIDSSQSRVAKLEAGHPSVSIELLVKAALAAGADRKQIAKAMVATPK